MKELTFQEIQIPIALFSQDRAGFGKHELQAAAMHILLRKGIVDTVVLLDGTYLFLIVLGSRTTVRCTGTSASFGGLD